MFFPIIEWICAACTLINEEKAGLCAACGRIRQENSVSRVHDATPKVSSDLKKVCKRSIKKSYYLRVTCQKLILILIKSIFVGNFLQISLWMEKSNV